MRQVFNISLPSSMTKEVENGVRQLRCASKSEFFRHLIRKWSSGNLLVDGIEKSRKEYRAGKAKKLVSMKDLW